MADDIASLLVRITADGSQAVGVINGVTATVNTLAEKNATTMKKLGAVGNLAGTVGGVITKTIGVGTVAALTASAKAASTLNKELANIGTLSVPTERLKTMKGDIQSIAVETGKSTSDISEGTYQVVSAFGDAADTMEKVRINAKAAKAGLSTTNDSIALTSAVTKAYGDTSAEATQRVADLAFKTVELGQTTFPELATSVQQVTSLSKELGVSQEELFGVYATLTGVTGNAAEVQTQLKAVYTALLKPSENMTNAIGKLGYQSGYSMIQALGFAGTLDALKKATNGSEEEMLGLFNNVRAMPAVMALTGAQSETFATKLEKMKNASGAATKAFDVQTKGVAKTGFTLEQAKIKMQTAAQGFGESAAPLIADVADIVDRGASALAGMSDAERKTAINTAVTTTKIGAALAVGGKAITVGTKFAGMVKAIGATGALLNPVTAGIAGVGTAVLIGKVAYDKWYDSQYRWSKGLSDGNKQISESMEKFKSLSDIQGQIKTLKLTIENPQSSKEQVETARSKLDEIREMLSKEYNLVINSDNSDLEEAVEAVKTLTGNELTRRMNEQQVKLAKLSEKISDKSTYENEKKKYSEALEQQSKYAEMLRQISEVKKQYGVKGDEQGPVAYAKAVKDIAESHGLETSSLKYTTDILRSVNNGYDNYTKKVKNAKEAIDAYDASMNEYRAISTEMANWQTELIGTAVSDGNFSEVETHLKDMGELIRNAELDMSGYAIAAAQAMNGIDFSQAVQKGGADLEAFTADYVRAMKTFGAAGEQTAVGAALIKNGFKTVKDAADAGALETVKNQALEMIRAMTDIPADTHIEISAEGDVSLISETQNKIDALKGAGAIHIGLDADGNTAILDRTDNVVKYLEGIGNIHVQVDAEGNTQILNDAEQLIATLPAEKPVEVDVNANTENAKTTIGELNAEKITVTADANTESAKATISALNGMTVTINPVVATKPQAKGTQNFPGGLAMVNDERGVSDNRELIVDNGRAFIPQGRDVILPLSRGAKVYTARQTKQMMQALGIPRYADGKNNSDAFTAAQDNWSHYTRTHAVTTSDELAKWVEFSKQFKDNLKDVEDIEEQIFSLTVKQNEELNTASEKWMGKRIANNDWDTFGDTFETAFGRIRDRNLQLVSEGKITWDDYVEYINQKGEDMYDDRSDMSLNWLNHEKKYNNMSSADYIAGLDRMTAYTKQAYAAGIIDYEKYAAALQDINDRRIDETKEANAAEFSNWKNDADTWYKMRSTFGDWEAFGDSPVEYYKRVAEETERFYREGKITFKEYTEGMNEAAMSMFNAQSDEFDKGMQKFADAITAKRDEFSKMEQALQDSWTVADRSENIDDLKRQISIYEKSVTNSGRDKLKQLQEQLRDAERQQELYEMQKKHTEILDKMQAKYDYMEDNKNTLLKQMVLGTASTSGMTAQINAAVSAANTAVSAASTNIYSVLTSIYSAIKGISPNSYTDSRNINIRTGATANDVIRAIENGITPAALFGGRRY